jgi:hypothetical protein
MPHPVKEALGPLRQKFVDGPYGPPMSTYICASCGNQFPDVGLYFYGESSIKCIWCKKFPKSKGKS